ncbi:MAG TPA: DUF3187 family protein [Candidatus Polarisedimenticolia bacterium]|nr:DUF3187 family protein [Candidatus Polarisedimenticolia bacterium]
MLAALLTSTAAYASDLDDPFPLRNQLPFNLLLLNQTPVTARLLPPGQVRLALTLTYENTQAASDGLVRLFQADNFATYGGRVTLPVLETVAAGEPGRSAFILDGETLRATFGLRVGLTSRVEAGLEIPVLLQSGGFLDSIIDGYHDRFNFPDGGRSAFARNQYVAGYVGDGEAFFLAGAPSGPGLGDIVISARASVLGETRRRPAVAAGVTGKLPTGSAARLRGSGSFDYAGSIQASKGIGRSTLHAGFLETVVGDWEIAPKIPLRNTRSLFATYVFSATARTSLIAQTLRSSSPFPFRTGSDLGRVAWELAAGFRHRLPKEVDFECALIENIDRNQNTPDIGVFFGLSRGIKLRR